MVSEQGPLSNTPYYLLLAYLGRGFHCTCEDHTALTFNSLTVAYGLKKTFFHFFSRIPIFQNSNSFSFFILKMLV